MREILFRGKDEGTKEWVYGYYYESQKPSDFGGERRYYIFDDKTISKYNVIPETVGQYTGLVDKNGKKIFEGDILEFSDRLVIVFWHAHLGCWDCNFLKFTNKANGGDNMSPLFGDYKSQVIGNIHDKPELMEGEQQ